MTVYSPDASGLDILKDLTVGRAIQLVLLAVLIVLVVGAFLWKEITRERRDNES